MGIDLSGASLCNRIVYVLHPLFYMIIGSASTSSTAVPNYLCSPTIIPLLHLDSFINFQLLSRRTRHAMRLPFPFLLRSLYCRDRTFRHILLRSEENTIVNCYGTRTVYRL